MEPQIPSIVSLLVGLQFAAFGWRVNREISVGDKGERTWLPIADIVNILNFFLVTLFCIVIPIAAKGFAGVSMAFLASGFTLLFFHPLNMLGHYELLNLKGRSDYAKVSDQGEKSLDFEALEYCPMQEKVITVISVVCAMGVWLWVYFRLYTE